jgi:type 1 glutamine amidotransferase
MTRWIVGLLALAVLGLSSAAVAQERPVRVLYLSQSVGFVHETVRRPPGGLAPSELALQAMAADSGAFSVELTQDAREITPQRLADIDVLMVSTTGALPIDRATWRAIVRWIESGRGGFVGVHSAADTALAFDGGEAAYVDLVGGKFDGHPWTEGTPIRLANLEPDHPLAAMWPDGTDYAEEIYQYSGFRPERVRVLQTLDMAAGPLRRPYPVPVTWVRQVGQGRLFYTNLGHTLSTWDDPRFRAQIVAAIRWTGRRTEAPTEPNLPVQDQAAIDAFTASQGEPPAWEPADAAHAIRGLQPLYADEGPEAEANRAPAVTAIGARLRTMRVRID